MRGLSTLSRWNDVADDRAYQLDPPGLADITGLAVCTASLVGLLRADGLSVRNPRGPAQQAPQSGGRKR